MKCHDVSRSFADDMEVRQNCAIVFDYNTCAHADFAFPLLRFLGITPKTTDPHNGWTNKFRSFGCTRGEALGIQGVKNS